MIQTLAVTKAMTSLSQAHQLLELSPASDPYFFTDWFEALPELSDQVKPLLNRYRDRYFYYAIGWAHTLKFTAQRAVGRGQHYQTDKVRHGTWDRQQ